MKTMSSENEDDEGFPAGNAGNHTSESSNELHSQEVLADIECADDFQSSDEALQTFQRFAHLLGSAPLKIDSRYREQRWWAFGTGSAKAEASGILTLDDRELIEVEEAGPFDYAIKVDGEYIDEGEFLLIDTTDRDALVNHVDFALENADIEQGNLLSELFDENRVQAITEHFGMGRDATSLPPALVPHPEDITPLVHLLTPDHAIDSLGVVAIGGGSATGVVPILDRLFREGPLQHSSEAGHFHQLLMQTESRVGNQTLTSFNGVQTDTNTQQAEALQVVDDLRADGYIGSIFLTNKPFMAVARAANESRLNTDDIESIIGSPHEMIDWTKVSDAVTGDRVIAGNIDNVAINDVIRWVITWEQFLRSHPSQYKFLTADGNHDRADHVDRAIKSKTLVPAVFSITSPEDIEGRHPIVSRPRTLEECVRAGVRFLPWVATGPINTENVTGATVAVGVADSQPLTQGDIVNYIEDPLAVELDLIRPDVNGIAVNDFSKWTMPGGASWLDFFGFLEVENHVETFERI